MCVTTYNENLMSEKLISLHLHHFDKLGKIAWWLRQPSILFQLNLDIDSAIRIEIPINVVPKHNGINIILVFTWLENSVLFRSSGFVRAHLICNKFNEAVENFVYSFTNRVFRLHSHYLLSEPPRRIRGCQSRLYSVNFNREFCNPCSLVWRPLSSRWDLLRDHEYYNQRCWCSNSAGK